MALDAQELAKKIHDTLSQKVDGDGKPTPISNQTLNRAKGIVAALKSAVVSNPPGTIVGIAAVGSPLSGGAGTGGVVVMTAAPMKALTMIGVPPEALSNIGKENDALISYIATGTIAFAPGQITGQCTNTAEAPGPLANGAGTGGKFVGITGAGAAAAVAAATGLAGPDMANHYNSIINYILQNAEVSYASGTVTGVCPPGGGPLSGGAGAGGTIS